jgi:hypothetical protein
MRGPSKRWCLPLVASLAFLVGCAKNPIAPTPETGVYQNPTFARVPPPPRGLFGTTAEGSLTGSALIDGAQGGVVTVGRFSVIVPPGAFVGTGTVTINVPDQAVVACELDIDTPAAAGFDEQISLVANCQGVTNVDLSDCGTLQLDASASVWRSVDGSIVHLENSTVVAPVPQSSTSYGIANVLEGRAGW